MGLKEYLEMLIESWLAIWFDKFGVSMDILDEKVAEIVSEIGGKLNIDLSQTIEGNPPRETGILMAERHASELPHPVTVEKMVGNIVECVGWATETVCLDQISKRITQKIQRDVWLDRLEKFRWATPSVN